MRALDFAKGSVTVYHGKIIAGCVLIYQQDWIYIGAVSKSLVKIIIFINFIQPALDIFINTF